MSHTTHAVRISITGTVVRAPHDRPYQNRACSNHRSYPPTHACTLRDSHDHNCQVSVIILSHYQIMITSLCNVFCPTLPRSILKRKFSFLHVARSAGNFFSRYPDWKDCFAHLHVEKRQPPLWPVTCPEENGLQDDPILSFF